MSSDVLTMWPNNSRPFFQCALCWRNSVRLSSSVIATGPAIAMTSGFTASTQPAAALFRDYIEQHGRHALTGDLAGRRYAIGHYSCPEQLGNRMMAFLNALLAAVVTNRTILWQYCHRDPDMCPMSGPVEGCQRVYRRQEWIASADEMLPRLGHTPRRPAYPARLERAR